MSIKLKCMPKSKSTSKGTKPGIAMYTGKPLLPMVSRLKRKGLMKTKTQEDCPPLVLGAWELSEDILFIYRCLDGCMDGWMRIKRKSFNIAKKQ